MSKTQKYPDCITVGELIVQLQALPLDMKVGRVGYFGEFNEMTKYDFRVQDSYLVPQHQSWRTTDHIPTKVLGIEPPNIGEEPD